MTPEFEKAYKALKEKYGAKISFGNEVPPTERVSTGSLAIDIATGGGWPKNKITFLNGKFSVGKTALAFHSVAVCQKLFPDKLALWIAREPFDTQWAITNGVDTNKLIVVEPETGEDAVNIWDGFLDTRDLSIAVFDSIGALASEAELEKEAENGQQGLRVKLAKKLMNKTTARLSPTVKGHRQEAICLFLNHIYDKIEGGYAIAGGNSVTSNAALMITFRRTDFLWELPVPKGEDGYKAKIDPKNAKIGIEITGVFEKDKTRPIGQPFTMNFFNRDGWYDEDNPTVRGGTFDDIGAAISFGQLIPSPAVPLIKKSGNWYTLGDIKANGEKQLWNRLKENPEAYNALRNKLLQCIQGTDE